MSYDPRDAIDDAGAEAPPPEQANDAAPPERGNAGGRLVGVLLPPVGLVLMAVQAVRGRGSAAWQTLLACQVGIMCWIVVIALMCAVAGGRIDVPFG